MKYINILRPWQWVKNLLILIPSLLNKPFVGESFLDSLNIFFLFSLLVSGNYILNDIIDIESDKLHPKKKFRPIASGEINLNVGKIYSGVIIIASIFFVNLTQSDLLIYFLGYLIIANIYSHYLKYIFILSSLSISIFFLIRLLIGGVVSNVDISIYLSTYIFISSFFIAILKKSSIINTKGIKDNDYLDTLKKENKIFDTEKLSLISLFLSNLTLIIWSIINLGNLSLLKASSGLLFLTFYFFLTLTLHRKSQKGDLEDFVLGFIKDKNLLGLSTITTISFYYFYYV